MKEQTNAVPPINSAQPTEIRRSNRQSLRFLGLSAPLLAVLALAGSASAAPNGTRPTVLTNLAVTSVSATQMKASGTLTSLTGAPIAGMRVDIYAVAAASSTRQSTAYTANNGTFSVTMPKPPVGSKIQVDIDGNGVNARPLPTFNRP